MAPAKRKTGSEPSSREQRGTNAKPASAAEATPKGGAWSWKVTAGILSVGGFAGLLPFLRASISSSMEAGGGARPIVALDLPKILDNSTQESLLWGTWRPGVYVGVKSRTYPESVAAGLMWGSMRQGAVSTKQLHHTCEESETRAGLKFRYVEHNGRSYGKQVLQDPSSKLNLTSVFVKSDPLTWTLHVEGKASGTSTAAVYFYLGVDSEFAPDTTQSQVIVEAPPAGGQSAVLAGTTSELGTFRLVATLGDGAAGGEGASPSLVAFSAPPRSPIAKVKDVILSKLAAGKLGADHGKKDSKEIAAYLPPLKADTLASGAAGIVGLQFLVTGQFSLDFVLCGEANEREDLRCRSAQEARAVAAAITNEKLPSLIAEESALFHQRFSTTFNMQGEGGKADEDVTRFAEAALSNLLGGLGFFYGQSRLKLPDGGGESTMAQPRPLFTAVPSRSFFPRGFLWDEGFHQLLVGRWDPALSRDAISHWLASMQGSGWIPREQILGAEAVSKVPDWAIDQHPSHANPPTLLLAIEDLLKHAQGSGGDELEATMSWLQGVFPVVEHWFKWFLHSQEGKVSGSFRWHGRDPADGKLNAMTLSSGLDDYPRAAVVSDDERHVDLHCWIAFGAGVLARIADKAGAEPQKVAEYRSLHESLVSSLDDLHWDDARSKFADYGRHCNEGAFIDAVVVKCASPDGRQTEHAVSQKDLQRGNRCPPEFPNFLFPLGDGNGGLLTRKKFKPRKLKQQFVDHTGYVNLFPLLLRLLPADSPKLQHVLDLLGNPDKGIWSDYGLRSLAIHDKMYLVENAPGDAPYWRGPIWINCNFLAVRALRHYASVEGPLQSRARDLWKALARNLKTNMHENYRRTGWLWEQYHPENGNGQRTHPFNGWSSLITLIMPDAI